MARKNSFGGYEQERFQNEVDSRLECSICLKVLKDPVQCTNEHYFCRSCIQTSLRESAESCPMCLQHLTEESLTKPPRILTDMLLSLMIRCDNASRGCEELVKVEFLLRHVESCGYSLTRCTNTGCTEVMNRNEKEQHERELCQFRVIVCGVCEERVPWKLSRVHPCFMRNELDELARRLSVVQSDMREVKNEVRQVKLTQEEMTYLTKEATERYDLFTGNQDILVCGGFGGGESRLNSVESFSWPANAWTRETAMKEKRGGNSAFVHEREIYVSGGNSGTKVTDSIECSNVDKIEWVKSPAKLPAKSHNHTMIFHDKSAVFIGGRENDHVYDGIYSIDLNPPYGTKLLARMPQPRCCHGCEIIDNQVMVFGGGSTIHLKDVKNTVYIYDINNNKFNTLPPLPFGIAEMATVVYKSNVILIGGVSEEGKTLNSVVMYDVKTGKAKMLPYLNQKRASSAAVITGNVIVVMGGVVYDQYETKLTFLSSVECLDLSTNVWRELSPMTSKRSYASAILKPIG